MTGTEDFLTATRTFYDTVAEDYADHFRDPLAERPLERALLAAYAEQVGPEGTVADLGCGPGAITAHLASLGLTVFGLDLSESMIAVARRENPGLRFEQGSMLELPVADGSLAGAVSWYSSIHTPADRLPALLAEFHRALAPGGLLLLAFQTGDVPLRLDRPWGRPVVLDFHRRRPEQMAELLSGAGFTLRSSTVREREEAHGESAPQAFLLARKKG
ncbi:methyltransferase domain-containing protein [Streptomyces actinomycinicus]|uniref:Methyltransferase domain-containing protein n=1 Tax=Streptomyces actinomycinicus TaxID=1695166 RepID=A0A937EG16_9ACTN|nr:class I SAM-dependent methyltransferase [Streptomyces actinomycinicus]MBL1081630.1 methyltransferase domain-containing protein [Streptomyces actinomycinicus]